MDAPIAVELTAVGQGLEDHVAVDLDTVELGTLARGTYSIAVDRLPVQLVGQSAATFVRATYVAADGVERRTNLPTLWVSHEPDYRTAWARSRATEARATAARGLARAPSAPKGRVWRAGTARFESVTPPGNGSSGRFVTTGEGLTSLSDIQAAQERLAGSPDPESKAVLGGKVGDYKLCINLTYDYADSGFGEDRFVGGGSGAGYVGAEPARLMWYEIYTELGAFKTSGFLSTSGCTDLISHGMGSYLIVVAMHVYRSSSNTAVTIYETAEQWHDDDLLWAGNYYTVNGAGGTLNLTMPGPYPAQNAAAIVSHGMWNNYSAFQPGAACVLTEQPCPVAEGGGCYDEQFHVAYLGGQAHLKYVVAHEFGHFVQHQLYGQPLWSLTSGDSPASSCRCWKLCGSSPCTDDDEKHCLQSREQIGAAAQEGFAHFWGADNLNSGSQSDCSITYYKHFRSDNGTVATPPLAKSCFQRVRWAKNHCGEVHTGTEYDWMNFFWELNNKGLKFTYPEVAAVYKQACGGSSCMPRGVIDDPMWGDLERAAMVVTPDKAPYWDDMGFAHGVDY